MVTFREEDHKYFNEHGVEYISTTTFLNKFKKPFDTEYHAARVAKNKDTTPEAVKAAWKQLTVDAQEKGKSAHKAMENYIKYGETDTDYLDLIKGLNRSIENYTYTEKHAESLLWNDNARIAGTADIILENKDTFYILDFKTNKRFNFRNRYGERLLPPLDHLDYCEFTIYTLQLSLYAYMKQELTGKHCGGMKILYLSQNSFEKSRYWRDINIFYCRETIENLLKQRKAELINANT